MFKIKSLRVFNSLPDYLVLRAWDLDYSVQNIVVQIKIKVSVFHVINICELMIKSHACRNLKAI